MELYKSTDKHVNDSGNCFQVEILDVPPLTLIQVG